MEENEYFLRVIKVNDKEERVVEHDLPTMKTKLEMYSNDNVKRDYPWIWIRYFSLEITNQQIKSENMDFQMTSNFAPTTDF